MSLQVPLTSEIADNIVGQIESSISQTVPLLPKAFTRVLAKALAAVVVLLWKYAGTIFLNMFVRTASMRPTEINGRVVVPLVEWGVQIGVGEPNAATQAELTLDVPVTVAGPVGTIPAGAQLVHTPTGLVYLTTDALEVPGTPQTVQVAVIASAGPDDTDGSGTVGNLPIADEMSWANPHPRIATAATVAAVVTEAVDGEAEEPYRARVLRRWQRKPQGGAYADYQAWAEGVAGVANAYPYTGLPGEVDVYVECLASIEPDGIPDSTLLDAVEYAISFDEDGIPTRRPVNAAVNVLPIARTAFDLEIGGLLPDTAANRAAIEAAVDEHLRTLEPFIVGLSTLPRLDRVSRLAISGVVHEIAAANGASVTLVVLFDGSLDIEGRALGDGERSKMGVVTWL